MKRVFISQPMRDFSRKEIEANRKEAILRIKEFVKEDFEIIDSIIAEKTPETVSLSVWYLGKALELLSTADVVYFAKGWKNNRGCRIENLVAHEYSLPEIIEEDYEESSDLNN